MSEYWVDIDVVLANDQSINMEYKRMMQEVPKHSKDKKYHNAHKVYEKKNFIVIKIYGGNKVGYILYNTDKEWKNGHTHLRSFDVAKTIASNVMNHKKPKTNNLYLIESHIRVSTDELYINYIEELIQAKRNGNKQTYYNKSR